MNPSWSKRTPEEKLRGLEIAMRGRSNGHVLTSDLEHRDPTDDIHNIDDGKFMSALDELPQLVRMMMESTDMHVEIDEVGDYFTVTKIVKMREPEFSQGTDKWFLLSDKGERVPVTEEELNEICGIEESKEDVYSLSPEQLEGFSEAYARFEEDGPVEVRCEHVAPRDVWDLVYDCSGYLRWARGFLQSYKAQAMSPAARMHKMKHEANKQIYSADFFPYPSDKRIKTTRAKVIEKRLKEVPTLPSKRLLAKAISGSEFTINQLRDALKKASILYSRIENGERKRKAWDNVERLKQGLDKARHEATSPITGYEKQALWNLWMEEKMKREGKVLLPQWKYEKAIRCKYSRMVARQEITEEKATEKLNQLLRS